MKLYELIKQFQWSELGVRLPELYPDQKKDLEGFKKAFARLQSLAPLESLMTILVTPIKEDCDEVEYACKDLPRFYFYGEKRRSKVQKVWNNREQ